MRKVTIKNISKLAMLILSLCLTGLPVQAQLNVFEPCTGSVPAPGNDIRLSGDAAFSDGYLRLNNHQTNSKGSMYINKAFPSQMGVVVEFEYWSYGNPSGTHGRGDGTSVFLFNGSIGPSNFKLGAYGGGLGYGEETNVSGSGLAGGFVAVGLDEYGNWKGRHNSVDVNSPSPVLGPGKPACIGIRGATEYRNRWIAGVMMDSLSFSLDYPVNTDTRPSQTDYYRKVRVVLLPASSGNLFDITVFMQTSEGGTMDRIIGPVATDRAPFDSLKVGLAASTGGAYAYHEIRNLSVTTPGEIRVETAGTTEVVSGNLVTYTATVYNESPSLLNGVSFMNILPTGFIPNGSPVFNGGTGNVTIVPGPNGYTENVYKAELNMPGYSNCTFTFTGRFDRNISGDRNVTNTATAFPPSVYTDTDLSNNTDEVETSVLDRTPEFYVNTIYYEDINGETTCGITQFEFVADTWLTPVSNDFPKWYINDIEEISEQGKSIWNKSLPTGSHTIRKELTDDNHQTHNISTTFIVKHYTATDANMEAQNASLCSGGNIDLNTLVTATGGLTHPVFRWYATLLDTIPLNLTVVSPDVNTTYYVSIEGNNHCETDAANRKSVTITLIQQPDVGVINVPGAVCINSTIILINETVNEGTWSSLHPDIAIIDAIAGEATGLNAGMATVVYTVTKNGCISTVTEQVTVLPNSNSSHITVTTNSPICENEMVIITASADEDIINPVFKWYESTSATEPFFTGNPYSTSTLTEDTKFYIIVSGDNYCAVK